MAAKSSQFLKFTDKYGGRLLIEGESIDVEHPNEIECTAWSWDAQEPSARIKKAANKDAKAANSSVASKSSVNTESEADGVVKLSTFGFSKATDKSTTQLLGAMNRGDMFPCAVMLMEEEFEESPMPFKMEIILTDVTVVQFGWDVSATDTRADMEEKWQLNYRTVNIRYDWRGTPTIQSIFTKTAEADAGASEKSPPSAGEKRAASDKEFEDRARRLGWKPPGKT